VRLFSSLLGANIIVQLCLLLVFLYADAPIAATYELYSFAPRLFLFYVVGGLAQLYLLNSLLRVYVFRSVLGRGAERAARSRGYRR